ncbi:MAG: dienelactone hydrolase family protein [Gemmobacter sp.]|nr:dienelactone hydrolase family protein [Gemmobacter sp.]
MTRTLNAKHRPARSGKTKSAVIFVHGYGADGGDLLGLADPLAPHLPDTAFHAPDAPQPCSGNPFGFQWFPIPWLDGSTEEAARQGLAQAADDLNAYVDGVLEAEGLAPDRLALVGFSQGSMMSLHIAPRRDKALAAVVVFSGRLLAPELLAKEARVKPPVLLLHGDADPMVPFDDMGLAGDALVSAGFDTYAHVMRGTGHGIAPDGLSAALQFLKRHLG